MAHQPIYILGVSAFYHDSSACLVKDGEVVAAALEERFTRIKHDESFPVQAAQYCLQEAGISIDEVQYVAYFEKPIQKFDRILNTFIQHAPKGFIPFKMAMQSWLQKKLWVGSQIKKELGFSGEIKYCKHHESHAASSYYTSPFQESAFLTIDGVGEKSSTTYGIAKGNSLHTLGEIQFPHSLGLLYSALTYYCGFKVNSGEYKLMGLAPYGQPKYTNKVWQLIELNDDGSYALNMEYFGYEYSLKMINQKFCDLFEAPARKPESEMTEFYKDVAASIQKVTEEVVLHLAKKVKQETGLNNLCMAGGVALNCVANGILQKEKIFDQIWIQPAAGDGGNALGAALQIWHQDLGNEKKDQPNHLIAHSYLGPHFGAEEIEQEVQKHGLKSRSLEQLELVNEVANLLHKKMVVGMFRGRMEFGPRALGNRSILAGAAFDDMQKHVNLKIKKREGFRPFAPIVKEESAQEWFDMPNSSRAMLFTYPCIQPDKIPSCVHVDHSARVQTLRKEDNEVVYDVLNKYNELSGVPVLINTSFNVRGEPIVCTPLDAIQCFCSTDMDVLVMENVILLKEDQDQKTIESLIKNYELD